MKLNSIYNLMNQAKFEKAEIEAKKLISSNIKEGYLILSEIYQNTSRVEKSIQILEEGVKLFPNWFLLWHNLGMSFYSLELYEKALDAFDKTFLLCTEEIYEQEIIMYKLEILCLIENYSEVFRIEREILENISYSESEESYFYWSKIFYSIAFAYWEEGVYSATIAKLQRAIRLDRFNGNFLWLLREIDQIETTNKSQYFILTIRANFTQEYQKEHQTIGFFTNYDVVADTKEEALSIIKEFEVDENVDLLTMQIEDVEIIENPDNPFKGIYKTYYFHTYEQEN